MNDNSMNQPASPPPTGPPASPPPTGPPLAPPGPPVTAPPTPPGTNRIPSTPSAPAHPAGQAINQPIAPGQTTQTKMPNPSEQADTIVVTHGVTKQYGSLFAVNNVNLAVPRNSIYALIGPNGAGKTTLMTMVASLLRPTQGTVLIDGIDPTVSSEQVRRKMGYMPDTLGVYKNQSANEYLTFFADAYRIPRKEQPALISTLLDLVELSVKEDAQVNSLSRGMKQRLSLARALIHDPELLILDEPASGLDPRARVELRELLLRLREMGKTIIVSSHILSELQEVCSHVGIVEAGQLLVQGTPQTALDTVRSGRQVKVTFADGTTEEHTVADLAAQAELLRQLVSATDRQVVEFTETTGDLEDVFMSVTKGIVQ